MSPSISTSHNKSTMNATVVVNALPATANTTHVLVFGTLTSSRVAGSLVPISSIEIHLLIPAKPVPLTINDHAMYTRSKSGISKSHTR